MNRYRLIVRSIVHYLKQNLTVALGIAVSTAVLTGALIIGDSIRESLKSLVSQRLGKVAWVMDSGERFFTDSLSRRIGSDLEATVASLLRLDAIVSTGGGQKRIPGIQVYGVDEQFDPVIGTGPYYGNLTDGEGMISDNLAARLDVKAGDEILLRIKKAGQIPLDAPFVSDADAILSLRIKVAGIAENEHYGRFSLQNTQTSPFNVFISRDYLNRALEQQDLVNLLLVRANPETNKALVNESFNRNWKLEDAGLNLIHDSVTGGLLLRSPRVFLDNAIVEAVKTLSEEKTFWFTYFVNEFITEKDSSPYSFVSTLPGKQLEPGQIIINEWLASDLDLSQGDSIRLEYYLVGPLRNLVEMTTAFKVKEIVPIQGIYADRNLMPEIPGLSDAGNCRDWETSIPIDLEKIRKKDEAYWNVFRGTPKAFINLDQAAGLWKNRFGKYTQVRFEEGTTRDDIEKGIFENLDPASLGYVVREPMTEGIAAAQNGVDFGQLFIGLSFFLMVSAVILTILLVQLNLRSRSGQLGTFKALGWPEKDIRHIHLAEGFMVSLAGVLMGLMLTLGYNLLIFKALNSIWNDIVLTDSLILYFRPQTLAFGLGLSLVIAITTQFLTIDRYLRHTAVGLQQNLPVKSPVRSGWIKFIIALLSGLTAILLTLIQSGSEESLNPGLFFMAGSLMLISLLLLADFILRRWDKFPLHEMTPAGYLRKNLVRNRNRSLSVIILFSIGIFLVIAIGANRKDAGPEGSKVTGGTGGFQIIAESTMPVLENLNDPDVRNKTGFETAFSVVQIKKQDGDDASCLNLNQVSQPPILGVPVAAMEGRFSFATGLPDYPENQLWQALSQKLPGGAIPAIADQTVIQWGLGLKIGDTLRYLSENGDSLKIVLIGGLANSIFQGNLIVSDRFLTENYPSNSGTRIFLFDGDPRDQEGITNEFSRLFRDFGIEMMPAAEKLARFNSVENTYLSIFLVMGALGMLLGTVGLGIILLRNLQERSRELALLRSVGFSIQKIMRIVVWEYAILLMAGTLIGGISSIASVLPGILSPTGEISLAGLLAIFTILLANGMAWIIFLTRRKLKKTNLVEQLRND